MGSFNPAPVTLHTTNLDCRITVLGEADAIPLVPGEPTELFFELLLISMIVKSWDQIRLVIDFVARGALEKTYSRNGNLS